MIHQIAKFLSVAWEAADIAGALIRENWEQPKQIDYKSAIDLVTSVDRDSECRIVEVLQRNFRRILSLPRKKPLSRVRRRVTVGSLIHWTARRIFAHRYPHFCISIALEIEAAVVLGLIYDPLRRECFRAIKGQGATLNGNRIRISETVDLDKSFWQRAFLTIVARRLIII